jgi:transposase
MSRRPRRNHSAAFKAKVAIDALGDNKTIADIATKHDVHPHQVSEWRRQLLTRAAEVFGGPAAAARRLEQPAAGS